MRYDQDGSHCMARCWDIGSGVAYTQGAKYQKPTVHATSMPPTAALLYGAGTVAARTQPHKCANRQT